jgi:hypothetical protein
MQGHVVPFGRHKGKPLPEVPASYLDWLLREVKLSTGLRNAVAGELARRGVAVPPPPAPKPPPPCSRCRGSALRLEWMEDSLGRRQVRRSCAGCGGFRGFAGQSPANVAEADGNASPTAVLDALQLAEADGCRLVSDGRGVSVEPWDRGSERLKSLVRQQQHLQAGLLGKGRTA